MEYEHTPTTDELFKVVLINRKRKVKINIQLRDASGDEIPIRETVEKLTEWIGDKAKSTDENTCQQQIIPLMGQAMTSGMIKLLGPGMATVMLSQEDVRYSIMNMMTVGFYLLKWLQSKNIKICTYEEDITQDDIDMYDRVSRANDLSVQAAALGADPKDMVKKLLKSGQLKKSDLQQMGVELNDEDDTEAN